MCAPKVDLRHIDEAENSNVVEIGVDLSEFYMSVEWDILEVPAVRNERFYTCCDEPYLDITFNITMRRKTLFYTVNLIIPCMGISFLTVLVFYLPSDSGEKVCPFHVHKENKRCEHIVKCIRISHLFKNTKIISLQKTCIMYITFPSPNKLLPIKYTERASTKLYIAHIYNNFQCSVL